MSRISRLSSRVVPLLSEADRHALEVRWREPHRCYHTMQHLNECLALLASVRSAAQRPDEVEAALWLHDAVYDPHAADNEEQSAALAADLLGVSGAAEDAIERVRRMILATRHDSIVPPGDAALVCDIDLAILGQEDERFAEYERQVRAEYEWVPAAIFQARRAEILRQFLARPQLFTTASLRERFEARARANITRSLARLQGEIGQN
jgi:predicted metal-dependent HD superfamily phosphohydrolase